MVEFVRQSAVGIVGCFLLSGSVLVGCSQAERQPPQAPPPKPVAVADPVTEQQQRLQERHLMLTRLLELAENALGRDQLRYPSEDNAYSWYQQVLALDELNADAHWGMKRITQRYFELAEQAFETGEYTRAEQMLRGAVDVAATPAQAEAIRAKYRDRLQGKMFPLSLRELQERDDSLLQKLTEVARRARDEDLRLLIVARNDAEGRWIYQQMRNAVDGYRLRGNIEVGDLPRIVLIDL